MATGGRSDEESIKRLIELEERLAKRRKESRGNAQASTDLWQTQLETESRRLDIQKDINERQGDSIALIDAEIAANEKNRKILEGKKKEYAAINDLQKQTDGLAESFAVKLGIGKSEVMGMAKGFKDSYDNLVKANKQQEKWFPRMRAGLTMIGSTLKSFALALNPLNILESVIKSIWKASFEFWIRTSKAIAGFTKATGDAGKMAKDIGASMDLGMGVNIEEAAGAMGGLANSFTGFVSLASRDRRTITTTAAAMERLGVGAGETGSQMNLLSKGMGMNMTQMDTHFKEMTVAANALGSTPQKMQKDFSALAGALMAHGPNMKRVFLDLAATAMASGLEMAKLVGLADKFDTFDSAASTVGNLNALLGGDYLNSLEMMNMTENERVEAVKRSIEMTGKDFMQMERFERKAIAEQLGYSTAELSQLMGYKTEEGEKARLEAEAKAKQTKDFRTIASRTVDVMERISYLFQTIFAKTGLMNAFTRVFTKFSKMLSRDEGFGKMIHEITDAIADMMIWVIDLGLSLMKYLVDNREPIMEFFNGMVVWVKKAWKDVKFYWNKFWTWWDNTNWEEKKDDIKDKLIKWWSTGIQALSTYLESDGFKALKASATKMMYKLLVSLKELMPTGTGWLLPDIDDLKEKAGMEVGKIRKLQDSLASTMGKNNTWNDNFWTQLWDKETAAQTRARHAQEKKVEELGEGLETKMKIAAERARQSAANIAKQSGEGVIDAWDNTGEKMKAGFASAIKAEEDYLQPMSPKSGRYYRYGEGIRDGLFDGLKPDIITQIFDDLAKSAEKFGKALKNVADAGKSASAIKVMDKAIQYQKEIAKNANNRDALAEILKVSSGKGGSGEGMEIVLQIEDMKLGRWMIDTWKKEAKKVSKYS